MPSVYELKPRFQALWRPLVARMPGWGIRPNHLTLAALAGSILVGVILLMIGQSPAGLWILPPWLLVRMALNAMDGMIAREYGQDTPLGAVLNELGDVLSDLALYLPLARVFPAAAWAVVSFCFMAVFSEFCGLLGPLLGAPREYGGPMGKSDRALLVAALALITTCWPSLGNYWSIVLGSGILLGVLTCFNRVGSILSRVEPRKD